MIMLSDGKDTVGFWIGDAGRWVIRLVCRLGMPDLREAGLNW
jgi:hypothetical protein